VTAARFDAYVQQHGAPVEVEKPASQRGHYLNPELFGQPETLRVSESADQAAD
jgi:hypothetical protein